MKNIFILILAIFGHSINAQTTDYNSQKGYVAEGYDVVSYFSGHAKKGDLMYFAYYKGAKYKFLSQENLDTFNAHPVKYIPQYGGYCAYAIGAKNEKVTINPETFEIRVGKLYLFYNSWGVNTLKSWLNETPDSLLLKANKNWDTLKFSN
jgi:YHS domain-containing protein